MISFTTKLFTASILSSFFISIFSQNKTPNVIIIYADDLGFGDVSCNGSKTIHTPNIDLLAKNGIRFTNMHSAAATSTPSRYALLTGEYPWRKKGTDIASGDAASIIRPDQFTIADVFKKAGYKTAAIGKWHLGIGDRTGTQDWNGSIRPCPNDIGFDYSFILAATGDRVPCVYIENDSVVNTDPSDPIYVSYEKNFDNLPTGKGNPDMLKLGLTHGHDNSIINGISRIGFMKGGKKALWVDEDIADMLTGKALKYIEQNKETPFFMYFGTQDIHVPRVPNQRFVGTTSMGPRGDAIMQLDWTVGKIIKKVEQLGLSQNTIILFSSDNGPVLNDGYQDRAAELLGNHKPALYFSGGKYSNYEGGTRVPGILSWPGTVKKSVSDKLICQLDFMATFAAMLGVNIPVGVASDSKNLSGLVSDKGKGRDFLVTMNIHRALTINDGTWKFIPSNTLPTFHYDTNIIYGNKPYDQLYNLKKDPEEKINESKEFPMIVNRLKALLKDSMSEK